MARFFLANFNPVLAYLTLLAISWPAEAQPTIWYKYSIQSKQVGYARITYQYKSQEQAYYKKKLKVKKLGNAEETEETSAVLASDYSVQSAYISRQTSQKKQFVIITVGDKIIIQHEQDIATLPAAKFYLELTDFLQSLVKGAFLQYGKLYQGLVLATDQRRLLKATARYLGRENTIVALQETSGHCFKVTTAELRNFWAKAWLDDVGNLLNYSIGEFEVIQVQPQHIGQIGRKYPNIVLPMIFDCSALSQVYLHYKSDDQQLFRSGAYQKVKGNRLMLQAPPTPSRSLTIHQIVNGNFRYLQPSKTIPAKSPLIIKAAIQARGQADSPVAMVTDIASWVEQHLGGAKPTPTGKQLIDFFGLAPAASTLATVALCRASGIPARAVAGLYLRPGKFSYTAWAEVYLGEWLPVYQGSIGRGARFLRLFIDTTWDEVEQLPQFTLKVYGAVKGRYRLHLEKVQTLVRINGDDIVDLLLGIRMRRPADWVLLPKNPYSDMLILRSVKGKGPAILLKVFTLPQPLEKLLQSVGEKIGAQNEIEILWQQKRMVPGGQALEIAMQSRSGKIIYRAFVAEKDTKGILAMLIVPRQDLMQIEKGFQELISSLALDMPN